MGSNPRLSNSNNMPQNSMPVQPQMGMAFPQVSAPFSNQNGFLNNGQAVGVPNFPVNQNGFMNHPNQLLQLQNNLLGMAQLAMASGVPHPGQYNMGFFGGLQNSVPNLNQAAMFQSHGQFGSLGQNVNQVNLARLPRPSQFYPQNFPRLPQQVNQPNAQFGFQNSMQNMNQFMPFQVPNYNMVGCANPSAPVMGPQNPPAQVMGPQNPSFFGNPQFGQVNQNQQNLVPPAMDVNTLKLLAAATQQFQGNLSTPLDPSMVQPQQNQNLQPSPSTGSQGNPITNGQMNTKWKNSPDGKFRRNQKREASQGGFQKSQFHRMKNDRSKSGFPNKPRGQGMKNERTGNFGLPNSSNQATVQKRSLSLTYTEQEIQHWREERKKNYPSKTNTEKKLTERATNSEVIDKEAKLRREQLKEILAKQAELGVEVAEIPSYYLSDSEKHVREKEEKGGPSTKKDRFQNKRDKRGRYNKKDRHVKKQKLADKDSSNNPSVDKKPTLLQKLLSADIKRDKSHLLQVFRFMTTNSFFKDWPQKPLKFPLVMAKENGCDVGVGVENSSLVANSASEGQEKTMGENFDNDVDRDVEDDDENDENINDDDDDGNGNGNGNDEEEGEIID